METKVKIIKDSVSHRIPLGSIVKLKDIPCEIRRNKKCYNVVDYACYIAEGDFEIIGDGVLPDKTKKNSQEKSRSDWFDDYVKSHGTTTKYLKGEKVKVVKVNKLTPNGTITKAKDGVYIIYETLDKKGIYWLRTENPNDINEYYCTEDSILGIVKQPISKSDMDEFFDFDFKL